MKKSNNNTWKRIAAGALSLALVAGALPANVGGLLTGGNVLVASAAEKQIAPNQTYSVGDTIVNNNDDPVYFRASHVPGEADNYIRISKGGSLTVRTIRYSTSSYGYKWMMEFQDYTDNIPNVDARIITNMAATYEGESYYTVNSLKVVSGSGTQSDPYVFGLGDYNRNLRDINDGVHVQISNVFYYTGSALEPVLKWVDEDTETETTLVKGTDYTIEEIKDDANEPVNSAKDAGLYQFIIKGKGQYAGSDFNRTVYLRIKPVALDFDNIAAGGELVNGVPSQLTYTGEEQAVKLYYKNGETYVPLTAGTDYDVSPNEGAYFLYGTEQRLIASNATNVGKYSAIILPKGNYKENPISDTYAFWSIAKANLKAGTDYTAPTGSDDLKYTGADIPLLEDGNTGSVTTVDSNTNKPVGAMQYALGETATLSASTEQNVTINSIDDVAVGTVYHPNGASNSIPSVISFPRDYSIKIGNTLYGGYYDLMREYDYQSESNEYRLGNGMSTILIDYPYLYVKNIDKTNKIIECTGLTEFDANNPVVVGTWSDTVPTATAIGDYTVFYKVVGDANHNDSAPAYVTSKIDYKKSTLTLAESLGTVKVTEVANGTETDVTGNNGAYTLSGSKTYKIYTENTVSTDEKSNYRLTEAYHNKANNNDVFEYEYTLKLAVDPAFGAYNLSHLSNWTGKVNSTDPTKLYIADGEVTPNTGKLAATLKANSTYYYGDIIDASSIEIDEAYKDLLQVKKVYFSDSTGANVDINKAKFGTYTLTAEIVVDNNANGKFDDKDVDLSYTVYKNVEYKARPMEKNDYFVETPDGKIKLTVDKGTVTVPEKYYVYSGIKDLLGGSGSDKKYVTTEKSEALSTIFSRCEEKQTFTYNGTEQKPTIIVKNGGNNADVVASIPATDTADAAAKDYIDGVKAETNAGDYSYTLTAETGTTEAPANYSGAVTVKWTIAQADIQQYISVAPKNNVDTDEVVGNDAIVYDGAALDGTDYIVSTNEAYAALTDSDADKATKALVDEYLDQLKATPATDTTEAVPAKTVVAAEAANAGEYPKSESPYPKENTFLVTPKEENDKNTYLFQYLIKSDNTHAAADDIIIMPKVNDNDESVEFKVYDSSEGYAVIYVYSDGKIGVFEPIYV